MIDFNQFKRKNNNISIEERNQKIAKNEIRTFRNKMK